MTDPPSATLEFDVHLTGTLLRKVAWRRLWRRWPLMVLAWLLVAGSVTLDLRRDGLSDVSVFALTAAGMQLLVYGAHAVRQERSISEWKRLQGDAPIRYVFTPDTVRATSNLGCTEIRWDVFRELREHRDYVLLGMGRGGFLTFPRAQLPPEAAAFLRERFTGLVRPA
jgi:hypothetical protein